jgi:hypothetical protein
VLACLVMITILYFELKATQGRMDVMRTEIEGRIRSGLDNIAEPVGRIPALEQRVQDIEHNVAVLQPAAIAEDAATHPDPSPAAA